MKKLLFIAMLFVPALGLAKEKQGILSTGISGIWINDFKNKVVILNPAKEIETDCSDENPVKAVVIPKSLENAAEAAQVAALAVANQLTVELGYTYVCGNENAYLEYILLGQRK